MSSVLISCDPLLSESNPIWHKNHLMAAEEMAQQLKSCTAFVKDPSLVPSIQVKSPVTSGNWMPSSGLGVHHTHVCIL